MILKGGDGPVGDLPEKTRRHLELEYSYNPSPDDRTKAALAQLTGLATEGVEEWFEIQRRRDVSYRQPTDRSHVVTLINHPDEQRRPPKRRTSDAGDRQTPGLESNRGLVKEQPERNEEAKSLPACIGDYEEDRSPHFTSERVHPGVNNVIHRALSDNRDDHPRGFEHRHTGSQARIPDGNTMVAPAWGIPQYNMNNEVATKKTHSKDTGDGEDESSLPGYMVFTSMGERVRKRRRRPFDGSRRREVAQVRKVGACADCRAKKTRCVHALGTDRLPPNVPSVSLMTRSSDASPLHPRNSDDITEPEILNILEPTTESSELPQVIPTRPSSASSMSTTPSTLMQSTIKPSFSTQVVPTSDIHTSPRPALISQSSNETSQQDPNQPDAISKIAVSSAPLLTPKPDSCPNCGFKPEGDPKWQKSNLARHMRVLHSGKPYLFECTSPECGRIFHRSDNLRAHCRKAHGGNTNGGSWAAMRASSVGNEDTEFVTESGSRYGSSTDVGKVTAGDSVEEVQGEEGLERGDETMDENENGI